MRSATIAAALVVQTARAADYSGAALQLQWCHLLSPDQTFNTSSGRVVHAASGLCATTSAGAAGSVQFTLQTCNGGDAQAWAWNASTGLFTGSASSVTPSGCQLWSAQGGPGMEGPGSFIGLWTCDQPAFDDYFAVSDAAIQYQYTQPGNTTQSGLCVTAMPLPPPPVPTPSQAAWLDEDTACFIHYNMATAAGTQGCGCGAAPPPIGTWAPAANLSTDAWIETGLAMGCTRFVYTAKHGCGFETWPTSVALPPGVANTTTYPYSVAYAPNGHGLDVVGMFLNSSRKYGVAAGFYYSIGSNALLNACSGSVQGNPLPGQLNVTQQQFVDFVLASVEELWGTSGPLQEIWMDGGYPADLQEGLTAVLARLQPQAVVFNGYGVTPNPLRWMGAESGLAPYPMWATADAGADGSGSPSGAYFMPAETDFTLQNFDQWFYSPIVGVHSPSDLRTMVETSTGHGTSVIIDIAPMPDGSVPPAQVAAAQTLGAFRRGCYGAPVAQMGGASGAAAMSMTLTIPGTGTLIDRVMAQEDLTTGQLIRGFTISAMQAAGGATLLFTGSSLSSKFIYVLPEQLNVTSITLNITSVSPVAPAGAPFVRSLSAYACNDLAARLDAEWVAAGW